MEIETKMKLKIKNEKGGAENEKPTILHGAPAGRGGSQESGVVVCRRVLLPPALEERSGTEILPQGECEGISCLVSSNDSVLSCVLSSASCEAC